MLLAEVFIRLVDDGAATRVAIADAVQGLAEAREVLFFPAIHLLRRAGWFSRPPWCSYDDRYSGVLARRVGTAAVLLGPGSIHYAHTDEERTSQGGIDSNAVQNLSNPSEATITQL